MKEPSALAGYRNSLASRQFEKSIAQVDSFAIGRLKDEGAVILGKTNAPEFGTRPVTEGPMFLPARNPVDVTRTAGGSRGGAAAAGCGGPGALWPPRARRRPRPPPPPPSLAPRRSTTPPPHPPP